MTRVVAEVEVRRVEPGGVEVYCWTRRGYPPHVLRLGEGDTLTIAQERAEPDEMGRAGVRQHPARGWRPAREGRVT